MRALITGMSGVVAPALADRLAADGWRATRWDRASMPADSESSVRSVIDAAKPDWVCHVATGAPDWAQWIARACADLGVRLLWTGSVSVFSQAAKAPITVDTPPDATDDYGRYKIDCERRVLAACPAAVVARLGWQIGHNAATSAPASNTMSGHLAREAARHAGRIEASDAWTPSCAFLDDTAAALATLMHRGVAGVYHVEGNTDGLRFAHIAQGLARLARSRGEPGWTVTPTSTPAFDNRMHDPRVPVRTVSARLTAG